MICPLTYRVLPRAAQLLKISKAWRCSARPSSVADRMTLVSSIARLGSAVTLAAIVAVDFLARPWRRSCGGLENGQQLLLQRASVPPSPLAQGGGDRAGHISHVECNHGCNDGTTSSDPELRYQAIGWLARLTTQSAAQSAARKITTGFRRQAGVG